MWYTNPILGSPKCVFIYPKGAESKQNEKLCRCNMSESVYIDDVLTGSIERHAAGSSDQSSRLYANIYIYIYTYVG